MPVKSSSICCATMRLAIVRLGILGLAWLCLADASRAEISLATAAGEDRWSRQVEAQWLPRTRAALQSVDLLARSQYGVDLGDRLKLGLAAAPKAGLPEGLTLLLVEAGLGEAELRQRALIRPVRLAMQALVDQLSLGQTKKLPSWLPAGLAEMVAWQTLAELGLPPLQTALPALSRPAIADPLRAEQLLQAQQRARLNLQLSRAAVEALQSRLGADFHPRMRAYLQAAGQDGFDANGQFAAAFGISTKDLLQQVEAKPAASPVKAVPALRPVTLVDASNDRPEVRKAWTAFMAAAKPRALAFSADGSWGLGEASRRSIDLALAGCRSMGGSQCRLIALDDEIVLRPDRAHVAVQMGGYVNDEFAQQVERDWLGLVRQASAEFDRLVNDVLKVRLTRDTQIYVGAGVDDYAQILYKDMDLSESRAELQGELSGGLSNSRGQIALKFTPKQNRAAAYELAVKTTLHELTHELQKQLGNNHAGFRPPVWIREGTADLIAHLLAPQVRFDDIEAQALRNWRERILGWWRSGNKTGLKPDDLVGLTGQGWLMMMKDKRGNYQMAGLMSMYLQAITGPAFLPAWVEYHRLAGQKNRSARASFELAFGLSEADFLADFKQWLALQ